MTLDEQISGLEELRKKSQMLHERAIQTLTLLRVGQPLDTYYTERMSAHCREASALVNKLHGHASGVPEPKIG